MKMKILAIPNHKRVAISKRGIYVQYKAIERPGKSEMTLIRNI